MPTGPHPRPRRFWWWIAVACLAVAGVGVGLFALAFRTCRFAVEPGTALHWSLTVRSAPLADDGTRGPERSAEHRLVLVGLGPETEAAAWLTGPAGGPPAQAQAVAAPRDLRLRLRGRDGRPGDCGPALAGFDFNLLPLPLGVEQEWPSEVVWAALPPGRRAVAVEVKRLRSGAVPQFRCDFPRSIEWVDPTTGRYRQVRDLRALYRFDTLRGVPREAEISFTLREEQPPPAAFTARAVSFSLVFLERRAAGDPARLRAAAVDAFAAEAMLAARTRPPAELLQRLARADGPFRELAAGYAARLGGR